MKNTHTNSESSAKPIVVEFDDFDFDRFNVKPATQGLGFHKREESGSQILSKRTSRKQQRKKSQLPTRELNSPRQEVSQQLSPFYKESLTPSVSREVVEEKVEVKNEPSQISYNLAVYSKKRLLAGFIDLLSIVLIEGILLGLMFISVNDGTLAIFDFSSFIQSHWLSLLPLGIVLTLFCLFTFSISKSPGQVLMNLKIVNRGTDHPPGPAAALLRSLILMVCFFMAYLPVLIDFHSMLSETQVIDD